MMRQALAFLALACTTFSGDAQLPPELEDEFMPVIAVVETSGPSQEALDLSWAEFENNWPNRQFCILDVRAGGSQDLLVPVDMILNDNVIYKIVNRDFNYGFRQSDWYDLCNLELVNVAGRRLQLDQVTTVALLVDVPLGQILASFNYFMARTTDASLTVEMVVPQKDRNYIAPMDTNFVATPVPTSSPSISPTTGPTTSPSVVPSGSPTTSPSALPSSQPSVSPTSFPSSSPSTQPSDQPSVSAIPSESVFPSAVPSLSAAPSLSLVPSSSPSSSPTLSQAPSISPSGLPSSSPSRLPSSNPSKQPSSVPSSSPSSEQPSSTPSLNPTSVLQHRDDRSQDFSVDNAFSVDNVALRDAAQTISEAINRVVVGDLPSAKTEGESTVCGPTPLWVDDLWVCYDLAFLAGDVVALVTPGLVRDNGGSLSPITGEIVLDWRDLYGAWELEDIGIAAMVHLLGVGTLWGQLVSDNCRYPDGTAAAREYQALSGCATPIPMEEGCSNFDNDCFRTSRYTWGGGVRLSRVVAGSLEDMNYTVDYNALDGQFTTLASTSGCTCRRRVLETQHDTTNPVGQRLSKEGRAKATAIGKRALAEKQKEKDNDPAKQEQAEDHQQVGESGHRYKLPIAGPNGYINMKGHMMAVVYRENGSYYTVIVRSDS